jgi:hypothetical protein
METEVALPHTQEHTTSTYPKPDDASPLHTNRYT